MEKVALEKGALEKGASETYSTSQTISTHCGLVKLGEYHIALPLFVQAKHSLFAEGFSLRCFDFLSQSWLVSLGRFCQISSNLLSSFVIVKFFSSVIKTFKIEWPQQIPLKLNHFKMQCFSSSFLLTWSKYTDQNNRGVLGRLIPCI